MVTKRKVSILGCGWVGKCLYQQLLPHYSVHCLSKDIEQNDRLHKYDVDVLVIAIPPKSNYLEVIEKTLEKINQNSYVILLSSISFYKDKLLVVQAEKFVQERASDFVILRLGGLMGYDRIAGKYTAGKTVDVNSVTNYVHRDDVVSIIECVIMKPIVSQIFDVVAPIQSTQKEVYSQNMKKFGFQETIFLDEKAVGKRLTPLKLIEQTGYVFKKESVLQFW